METGVLYFTKCILPVCWLVLKALGWVGFKWDEYRVPYSYAASNLVEGREGRGGVVDLKRGCVPNRGRMTDRCASMEACWRLRWRGREED